LKDSERNFGLCPRGALPPYVQPSERKVYEALALALPAGWSAWHSLKIHIRPGDFSEADFVIANPSRGILILEVKGGIVRKQDGVWFQNERPMGMSPLDQAHRFKRILREKCNEREIALPPIGVAVVFPDTAFEEQPTQGDLEGLVMGVRELACGHEPIVRRQGAGGQARPARCGAVHGARERHRE
jgi:hypothetical protein